MPKQNQVPAEVQYSKYNEAAQQISRLHELWLKISELRRRGRLSDWNFELDSVWTELAGDKNCNKEHETKFYSYMSEYVNAKKNPALLYQVLLRKHVFLKRLQDELGKGAAYNKKDDSGM